MAATPRRNGLNTRLGVSGPKRAGHFGLRAYVETTDARNESYWQGLAHEVKCCCISAAFSGVLDDLPGSRTILPIPFRVSNRRALLSGSAVRAVLPSVGRPSSSATTFPGRRRAVRRGRRVSAPTRPATGPVPGSPEQKVYGSGAQTWPARVRWSAVPAPCLKDR